MGTGFGWDSQPTKSCTRCGKGVEGNRTRQTKRHGTRYQPLTEINTLQRPCQRRPLRAIGQITCHNPFEISNLRCRPFPSTSLRALPGERRNDEDVFFRPKALLRSAEGVAFFIGVENAPARTIIRAGCSVSITAVEYRRPAASAPGGARPVRLSRTSLRGAGASS